MTDRVSRSRWAPRAAATLAAAGLVLAASTVAAGKTYRWVDEDGEVHYGDRMPADASRSEHAVIDDSGVVREQQRSADEEDAERERQRASEEAPEQAEARSRRDRMLLETFTEEEDLVRMRDRRLEAIDARIAVVDHQLEQLRTQRESYADHLDSVRAAATEDSYAVKSARERLERVEKRIEGRRATLADLRTRREDIAAEFAADLERFRELEAARGD